MKYEVRCECWRAHAVSAADAGSTFRCACGRNMEVPPLHTLRTAGGETAIPLLAQVRSRLLNGQLPGTQTCTVCGTDTNHRCRIKVICERVPNESGPSQAEIAGCLLAPYLGLGTALLLILGLRAHRENVGDEEAVIVPLPVCEVCRPKLNDSGSLSQAIRKIPDYAALLDRYRQAEVVVVD